MATLSLPPVVLNQALNDISNGPGNSTAGSNAGVYNGPTFKRSATEVQQKIRKFSEKTQDKTLIFPEEKIKYYMGLDYAAYSRIGSGSITFKVNFQRKGSIILPLPAQGISDTHEVEYEERDLGLVGAGATLGQNVAENINQNFREGNASGIAGNLVGIGGSLASGGVSGAQYLGFQAAEGLGLGGGLSAITGLTPNKFMTILLKGPKYKRHEFVWKLYPSNRRESITIKNIIYKLNNLMAPGLYASGLLWEFPYIFYMYYVPNHNYLYKFKPAILESLTTNYAPGGVPSFYAAATEGENPPESIEIRARFIEIEYWLRNQFGDEYKVDDIDLLKNTRNLNVAFNEVGDLDSTQNSLNRPTNIFGGNETKEQQGQREFNEEVTGGSNPYRIPNR